MVGSYKSSLLLVVKEVKENQQRPDISPSAITECENLGVFILPAAVHVSLAGSYLRISSRKFHDPSL